MRIHAALNGFSHLQLTAQFAQDDFVRPGQRHLRRHRHRRLPLVLWHLAVVTVAAVTVAAVTVAVFPKRLPRIAKHPAFLHRPLGLLREPLVGLAAVGAQVSVVLPIRRSVGQRMAEHCE